MKNKLKSICKSCFLSLIVSYILIKGIFFFFDFYFSIDSILEKSIIFLLLIFGLVLITLSDFLLEFFRFAFLNKSFYTLLEILLIVFEVIMYTLLSKFSFFQSKLGCWVFLLIIAFVLVFILLCIYLIVVCESPNSKDDKKYSNGSSNYGSLKDLYQNTFTIDSDKPLLIQESEADYDLFDRQGIVDEITSNIFSLRNQQCYVIGIEGEWGSGKTTLLNLVSKENYDSDIEFINFDIWNYSTNDSLLTGLYKAMFSGFEYHTNAVLTNRILRKVTAALADKTSTKTFYIPFIHDLFFDRKDGYKEFEDLNKSLELISNNSKKQLVIVVDNLERCEAKQIIFFIKLLNNLSSIVNVVFLVAYNKKRLDQIIDDDKDIDSHYYEKVINHVIQIPSISSEKYENTLDKCTENYLRLCGIENDRLIEYKFITHYVSKTSKTPRDYIRTMNSCFSNVFQKKVFLNQVDLLVISIIRFKDESLLDFIVLYSQYFLSENNNQIDYLSVLNDEYKIECNKIFHELDESFSKYTYLLAGIFPKFKEHYCKENRLFQSDMDVNLLEISRHNEIPIHDSLYFGAYMSGVKNNSIKTHEYYKKLLIKMEKNNIKSLSEIFSSPNYEEKNEKLQNLLICLKSTSEPLNYKLLAEIIIKYIRKCNFVNSFNKSSDFNFESNILYECLQKMELSNFKQFFDEQLESYKFLFLLSELQRYFRNDKSSDGMGKYSYLVEKYNLLCKSVLNEKIDLYSNENYSFRNMSGLTRYCINGHEILLKEYVMHFVDRNNIIRFLTDSIDYGVAFIGETTFNTYSVNLELWNKINLSVDYIEKIITEYVPKNETEKIVIDIFEKSKKSNEMDSHYQTKEVIQFAGIIS